MGALLLSSLPATVWHVSNNANFDADFSTLQTAHDNAQTGDTLYVYGSQAAYGDLNCSKKLTIFGPGFFLAENPNTQAKLSPALINHAVIQATAVGTAIQGMSFKSLHIKANSCVVQRNRFVSVNWEHHGIRIENCSNVRISQNYLMADFTWYGGMYDYAYGNINTIGSCGNIIISNNLVCGSSQSGSFNAVVSSPQTSNLVIYNNIITHGISVYNADIYNCYLDVTSFNGNSTCNVYNNICSGATLSGYPNQNNIMNKTQADVFLLSGSSDGRYALKPGSPALGSGFGNTDIGIFGGQTPYILSGLPAGIPSIYFINSGTIGLDIPVLIKAKTNP